MYQYTFLAAHRRGTLELKQVVPHHMTCLRPLVKRAGQTLRKQTLVRPNPAPRVVVDERQNLLEVKVQGNMKVTNDEQRISSMEKEKTPNYMEDQHWKSRAPGALLRKIEAIKVTLRAAERSIMGQRQLRKDVAIGLNLKSLGMKRRRVLQ